MIFLNSKNFHSWIIKMKNIVIKTKVWKYVDSEKKTSKSSNSIFSRLSHYFVKKIFEQSNQNDAFVSVKKSVRTFDELSSDQKKSYKMNIIAFQMKKKANDQIAHEIRIVDTAIKTSTRMYISSESRKSSVQKILQLLSIRYKRSDLEINTQLHEKFRRLKTVLAKKKIEKWIANWKNLKNFVIAKKQENFLEFEKLFVQNFFKTNRSWTFLFCDTWVQNKIAAEKLIKFFSIIKQYRVSVKAAMKKNVERFIED